METYLQLNVVDDYESDKSQHVCHMSICQNNNFKFVVLLVVGYTRAYPSLVPKPPAVSLLSLTPIMSIISQMVIMIGVQFFTWEYVKAQPW